MLKVVEGVCIRQGRGELKCGDGDLICRQKEECAEGGACACGDLWDGLGGDGIDYAHEGTEGVVNGPARFLLFFMVKMSACRFGDLSRHNLCGVFPFGLLLFLLHLLVSDEPRRFVVGQFSLPLECSVACRA